MIKGFVNEKELEELVAYEKPATIRFMKVAIQGWADDNKHSAARGTVTLDETLQDIHVNSEIIGLPDGLKVAGDLCMAHDMYGMAAKCYSSMGSKEGWKLAGDANMKAYYFRYAALCYLLSGMDKKDAGKIAGDGYVKAGEAHLAQTCYDMKWVD